MAFVLDNSVAVAWFLPSQSNDYTRTIAKRLETEKAWVPALWQLEIANVVRSACLRHNLALEQARNIFNALNKLPIQIDKSEGASARQLFELAMRLGLDLATQDQALKDAALAAKVSLAS